MSIFILLKSRRIPAVNEEVGLKGIVTTAIPANGQGEVLVQGEYWQAKSTQSLAKGTAVTVLDKNGLTLYVSDRES